MAQNWESVRSSPISAGISGASAAVLGLGSSMIFPSISGASAAVPGLGLSVIFPSISGDSAVVLGLWKTTSEIAKFWVTKTFIFKVTCICVSTNASV